MSTEESLTGHEVVCITGAHYGTINPEFWGGRFLFDAEVTKITYGFLETDKIILLIHILFTYMRKTD